MGITIEQLEKVLPVLDEVFNNITQQNVERARQIRETPRPMTIDQLGKRLGVRIDPENKFRDQTLLSLADAVLELPKGVEDRTLIEASYYYLIQEHAPWAIKKK